MMADENCKAIERHIKDLLFNKESLLCENSPNVAEYLEKKSPDTPITGNHQSLNKGNYRGFNHAVSPRKGYKVNPAFQNRSPVLHQEGVTGNRTSSNTDKSSYPNVGNAFSSPNYPQAPSSSSYGHRQMRDVRFLNIHQNSEQVSRSSHGFAVAPNLKASLNSHAQHEAILDKVPGAFEKLYAEKMCQGDIQISPPHAASSKSEFQKDVKNKKKKKKDRKKRTKHSPDDSIVSENVNTILDLLADSPVENNSSLSQEKFTPLQQKGNSFVETPVKTSKLLKKVSKPFFLEDKETIILRREGQLYFCCYICDYSCSDSSGISRHISSSNHKAQLKAKEMRHLLFHLPGPLSKQVESVTKCIVYIANTYGLSEDDLNLRKIVVDRVKEKIESHIPGCHLEPIGSSITGFGLKVSHIDIVLKVPKEKNAADILFTTFEMLKEDKSFKEVHNEFRKKIPQIEFVDVASDLTCNICIDNGTVSEFTKLLCDYAKLDPRVRVLGTAFRYWAKICEVDQQDQGTLPAFCYILMLIYFLQQQQPPVLPVLPKESDWSSKNTASIGDLWIKLFRYYSIEYQCGEDVVCIRKSEKVSCEDKNWGTKILAIEDPIVHRNLAHVIPNRQVYQYIHDCLMRTYNYFGRPQFCSGPAELTCVPKPEKDETVLDTVDTNNGSTVVTSTDTEKKQSFSEETLLSDDILNVSDLVEDHDPELPFDDVISIVNNLTIDEIVSEEEFEKDSSSSLTDWGKNTFENCRTHDMSPSLFANFPSLTIIAHDQVPPLSKISDDRTEQRQVDESSFSSFFTLSGSETYSWNLDKENVVEEIHYEFLQDHFKGDKSVPLVCNLCQKQGHQKKDCPDEILPAIAPLPPMTSDFITMLDSVCQQILEENQPSLMEMKMRDQDLQELEDYVRQIFPGKTVPKNELDYQDAKLQMFGSFCNGFGFTRSDMDICLTFKENVTGKDLDCLSVIEQLAKRLCLNPKLSNVVAITSAKVPIVKFVFKESGLEGDISLYNTLAQHNTRMLDMYCKIDQRVRVLGYTLKYFAKILNIGDASRGSLSSYAYILMVLFFLQQRDPPVIPVLQELHNGKQPILMVDEWNAWFYNDLENLPNVWTDYGKNKESVGELWLGLLRFYTEEFDSNEYVVCIRQKKFLTRFRKLWNSKSIAIEDPFDLSHNLGSGLSRRMNNYILKAFIRGRNHFGMSVGRMPSGISAKDFLFDRHVLCEGQDPPNDRGCRYCGKIGHIIKDCPKKTQKKQDQRKPNGPRNQNDNNNHMEDPSFGHRQGFQDRRGYQRKEYDKRSRHHGNRSPRNNNTQQNVAKSSFERNIDVPPGKINHLLSLQRFPGPGLITNSFNPPPFASKIPPSFVHRPATSTPFPIMNSALVTSLSPHKNSLTQHTAMYLSQPQNHPTSNNNAQVENSHCLTAPQKHVFLPSEHSLPLGSAHSNGGQVLLHSAGKQQKFRGHPRDDVYRPHNSSGRW